MLCEYLFGSQSSPTSMPPISKDCSTTFLDRSFMYAVLCILECQILIHSGRVLKQCYLHNTMDVERK